MARRPKIEPIRAPTLFEINKLDAAPERIANGTLERPCQYPGLFLGTFAFTANEWPGTFYLAGMKPADYLTFYASKFKTVEIDSTYYGPSSASAVTNWCDKTPPDFIFAAKVPQVITHDKVLIDCDTEFNEFITTMDILGEKLGPLVFQFPYFDRSKFSKQEDFVSVLTSFLKKLPTDHRFAIEIRNNTWFNAAFADLLREHKIALVLQDSSFMPRPWEFKDKADFITADFVYARWLGDRKRIEEQTHTWDKTVVDRREDLTRWVELLRQSMSRNLRVYAYANNHYVGIRPAAVKRFWGCTRRGETRLTGSKPWQTLNISRS